MPMSRMCSRLTFANADVAEFTVKPRNKDYQTGRKDLDCPKGKQSRLIRNGEGILVTGNTMIREMTNHRCFRLGMMIKKLLVKKKKYFLTVNNWTLRVDDWVW